MLFHYLSKKCGRGAGSDLYLDIVSSLVAESREDAHLVTAGPTAKLLGVFLGWPFHKHLEGFAYGVMLVLLLVFGFHPSFITNSLLLYEEEGTEQVAEEKAAEAPAEEVVEEEVVEEDIEPLESHIVSSADIAKLDSSLTQAGFSEEERRELIKQVIETEANMAKATAYAVEKQQREEEEARIRDAANKGYEEFDLPMESESAESSVKNEEASND